MPIQQVKEYQAMRGKVKFFSNSKGFGFLVVEGQDKDVFVHYSAIVAEPGKYKTLNENEEVEFDLQETPKGKAAANVVRVNQKKPEEVKTV